MQLDIEKKGLETKYKEQEQKFNELNSNYIKEKETISSLNKDIEEKTKKNNISFKK